MANAITLDTLISASTYFVAKWTPTLKLNQSRDVLRLVINKLYGASQGNLFHARIRCSHAALAASVGLSREWVCTLVGRLGRAGWLETLAPRLPDGRQEVTTFKPGPQLKRLLVMLLRSRQKSRANDQSQKLPSKEDIDKNKALLADLIKSLSQKLSQKSAPKRY
jgi:hypothetical protein